MSLLNKIAFLENLYLAFQHSSANRGRPGIDNVSIENFKQNLEKNLQKISQKLLNGTYEFSPCIQIDSTRLRRTISILTVEDRIVSQAIHQIILLPVNKHLHKANYAYLPGRSAIQAVKELQAKLKTMQYPYVLRCDIRNFFDEMDHKIITQFLSWVIGEKELTTIHLIEKAISIPFVDEANNIITRKQGIPQGSSLSPIISNLYLTPMDHYLENLRYTHFRFCDDLAILLKSKEEGDTIIRFLVIFLQQQLKLQLNLEKSKRVSFVEGFDYLGFHFSPQGRTPGKKAQERIKKRLEGVIDKTEQKQIIQRWQAYYGNEIDVSNLINDEVFDLPFMEIFGNLFKGNPKRYATGHKGDNRSFYRTIRKPITEKELILHILGKHTIGFFPLYQNKISCTCLDIDISKKIMETIYHTDSGRFAVYQDRAIHHTRKIEKILKSIGIHPLIEQSGYKGYHIWIFFVEPISAQKVNHFWQEILEVTGKLPQGIKREILPRESHNLGRLGTVIKMPLGLHPFNGARSVFIDKDENPISNPYSLLQNVPKVKQEIVENIINKVTPLKAPKTKVSQLIESCSVIRKLYDKAKREQDLGHFERLILLYTVGQLGDEGAETLHEIIGHCYNYSPSYTQSQIEKKHPSPIGCRRIHEIMGEEMNSIEHCCHFDIPKDCYASPLLHVYPEGIKTMKKSYRRERKA